MSALTARQDNAAGIPGLVRAGRFAEAERALRVALAKRPGDAGLLNILGVVQKNTGRLDEALATYERAARANPRDPAPVSNAVNVLLIRRDAPAALRMAEALVREHPAVGEYHRQLGAAHRLARDHEGARACADQAAALAPTEPQPWIDGAVDRESLGDLPGALARIDAGLTAGAPPRLLVQARLVLLRRAGRGADAAVWVEAFAATQQQAAWLELERARCLLAGDRPRANLHLRAALALAPEDVDVLMELADSLDRTRGAEEGANIAEAYGLALRRIRLGGVRDGDRQVLRNILHRSGDYAAAERLGSFEQLGEYWSAHGQIAALHYHLAQVRTPEHRRLLVAWHRRWGRMTDAATPRLPAPAVRSGRARIRVGLMSSDLRNHPVSYFALPIVERFDRARFELFCYSFNTGPADKVQQHVAAKATTFRLAPGIADRDAAAMIHADGLDMLFELGGTTHMNKLRVMSYRPAPLQASWVGYPHSAGPESIDFILTDPHLRPPDPALLIERPFELPHSWVTLGELGFTDRVPIEPGTPEARAGVLTFGTMNNPYKYNAACLRSWARVVAAVPGSRFLFVRPEGSVAPFRDNMLRAFVAEGVPPERVLFQPVRGNHLPHYNRIDIALDTFPQTGGTTTCEALWMGVPTVTLVGEAFFERLSYSNLINAGLPELCCATPERFHAVATGLAADAEARADWRGRARTRLRATPLGRVDRWVEDFQDTVARTVASA